MLKDFVEAVKENHLCQVYTQNMHTHLAILFPVITVGPFRKWGIDFTTCNLPLKKGHKYIIIAVDYFNKWAQAGFLVRALISLLSSGQWSGESHE